MCNEAVSQFPPIADLTERYLFMHNLGRIPEAGWSLTEAEALQRIAAAEDVMCGWATFGRTPADLGRRSNITPDGAIQWGQFLHHGEAEEWRAVGAGGPMPDSLQKAKLFLAMDKLSAAVALHQASMTIICRRLGLGGSTNPTVQGRTWLVQWPVVEAAGVEGTRVRNEAALVVAAPGAILMARAVMMLIHARDLGDPHADVYPTELASFTLRLSEPQRLQWGPSMHRAGKVYWAIQDGEGEPQSQPRPSKKAGRKRKERPLPPEE
jgi:hypothetical protein